jgi:hypothetical protein
MPTLDEIREEWTEHDLAWQEKYGALLMRAVEQLSSTRRLQGFKVSDLLRVIADDYNRPDVGSMVKQRRSMWLNDLADKMDKTDPDVLELIAKEGS